MNNDLIQFFTQCCSMTLENYFLRCFLEMHDVSVPYWLSADIDFDFVFDTSLID